MSKFRNSKQDDWMGRELNPEMENGEVAIWIVALITLSNPYTWIIGAGIAFWNLTKRKSRVSVPPKPKSTSAMRLTWRGAWQEERRQKEFAEEVLHSDPESRVTKELTTAKQMMLAGGVVALAGLGFGAKQLLGSARAGGLLSVWGDAYIFFAIGAGGLAFLAAGMVRSAKFKRFSKYLAHMDGVTPIRIDELAASLGIGAKTVFDDFDEMMGRHFILEGCLDTEERVLTFTEE